MKQKKIFIALCGISIFLFSAQFAHSQVVISLLFGKKLNTENVQFGLDGGVSFSSISNLKSSDNHTGFNLGLYFDIRLKEQSNFYLHTGLLVKSPLGEDQLDPYSLGDPALDSTYGNGTVDRQLKYLYIPVLFRYKFDNQLYLEAGPMAGVLVKATDVFYASLNEDKDQSYKNNIYDGCNWLDAGLQAGIGYHLMKGNGMNIGFRYYLGLTDIIKDNPSDPQKNSVAYIYASIPIGAGDKAKAKKEEKDR